MSSTYILGIDQSTQGTKGILFDERACPVVRCDLPHRQIVNDRGWVEHDPEEIYRNTLGVVKLVLEESGVDSDRIAAVGISNQRETSVAWNRATGKPICNAIVWQCARGASVCERVKAQGKAGQVRKISGIPLSPYFPASKWGWIMDNVPEAKELAEQNELCLGTVDSWLLFNLTGGKVFATDHSNASRTQLMDLDRLAWSGELCKLFHVPLVALPEILPSDFLFGESDFGGELANSLPIHSVLGDSHAALFGQGCHMPGMAKATYGTGSSVMMNIGERPLRSDAGVVTSVAWSQGGKTLFALEGNINYTGAVISWLEKDLGLIASPKECEALAKAASPEDKTYFVPAFTGLGAPYWDSEATGVFCGITRTTGKAEMVRAAEDCIAHQIADIVELMGGDSGLALRELRVDGGPTRDGYLMQMQSDLLNIPLTIASIEEISALGAAVCAGISTGTYPPNILDTLADQGSFLPAMNEQCRDDLRRGWKHAVSLAQKK